MRRPATGGPESAPRPRGPRALLEDTRGAVFAEYVVILILVAVACILGWQALHRGIEDDAREEYVTFGYPPDE